MSLEKNLLFAATAIQYGFIRTDQLTAAAVEWAAAKDRPLADILVAQGGLQESERALVEQLVERSIQAHGGQAARTLAGLPAAAQILQPLQAVKDPALQETLALLGSTARITASHRKEPATEIFPRPANRYSIHEEIGHGGLGRVLLAVDNELMRQVAMKELLPRPDTAEETPFRQMGEHVARFLAEARITGHLEHPSIVPVYEIGRREDGSIYYTMRVVRGRSLADALRGRWPKTTAWRSPPRPKAKPETPEDASDRPADFSPSPGAEDSSENRPIKLLPLPERLALLPHFVDVCQAVAYAHSRGVIHRDLKPQNIMIGQFGETVVIDWGLAKVSGQEDLQGPELAESVRQLRGDFGYQTLERHAIGTPAYMPPEQAEGKIDQVDARSDVFALGSILYEILTGRPPFIGKTMLETLELATQGSVAPALDLEPQAPPELAAICQRALRKNPADRYPTAESLAEEVHRFLSGQLVSAYAYPFQEHLKRWARRHKAPLSVAIIALIALVSLAVYAYMENTQARKEAERHARDAARQAAEKEKQRTIAESQREEAERQRQIALARQLAAQADASVLENFLPRSLLLATESLKVTESLGEQHVTAAEQALRNSLRLCGGRPLRGHTFALTSLAISPDSRWAVSASQDRTLLLWKITENLLDTGPAILQGHEGLLHAVSFSPDGRWIAGAGEGHDVFLWELSAGGPAKDPIVLRGHTSWVRALAFSSDGRWLASAGGDSTALLWDLNGKPPGASVVRLQGHEDWIFSIAISSDSRRIATASHDKTVRIWEMTAANPSDSARVLKGHIGPVQCVVFSPDNRWMASSGLDSTARLWDLAQAGPDLSCIVLPGHSAPVNAMAVSADSRWLATASADATARLWRLGDRSPAAAAFLLRGHRESVNSVAFSPDSHWVVTASSDHTARRWDLRAKDPSAAPTVFWGHEGRVSSAAISPDSQWLITASDDSSVRAWKLGQTHPSLSPLILEAHPAIINACVFAPHQGLLITAGGDAFIRLWKPSPENPENLAITLQGHTAPIRCLALSKDGRRLVSGSADKTARIWDLASEDPSASAIVLKGHDQWVNAVALDQEERLLATMSQDGSVRIWLLSSKNPGDSPVALPDHGGAVLHAFFTHDGHRLITAGEDRTVRLWNLQNPAESPRILQHPASVVGMALSADSRWLATASWNQVVLWDLEAADPMAQPVASFHDAHSLSGVALSPDFHWLVGPSFAGHALLWDLTKPAPADRAIILRGHEDYISAVAVSPDSRWLATGSGDRTVRLWDLQATQPATASVVLRGHGGPISRLAFSPDNGWLASGSSDGTVRLWTLRQEDLVELARRLAGRNLTAEEWERYLPGMPYRATFPGLHPKP